MLSTRQPDSFPGTTKNEKLTCSIYIETNVGAFVNVKQNDSRHRRYLPTFNLLLFLQLSPHIQCNLYSPSTLVITHSHRVCVKGKDEVCATAPVSSNVHGVTLAANNIKDMSVTCVAASEWSLPAVISF